MIEKITIGYLQELQKIKEIAEQGLENIDQSENVDDLIDYAKDALKGIINNARLLLPQGEKDEIEYGSQCKYDPDTVEKLNKIRRILLGNSVYPFLKELLIQIIEENES